MKLICEICLDPRVKCKKYELRKTTEQSFRRECLEEIGAEVEILDNLGIVLEYRNTTGLLIINYCFVAKIVGKIGKKKFSKGEIADGVVLEFHKLDKAIEIIKSAKPFGPRGKTFGEFLLASGTAILEAYKS